MPALWSRESPFTPFTRDDGKFVTFIIALLHILLNWRNTPRFADGLLFCASEDNVYDNTWITKGIISKVLFAPKGFLLVLKTFATFLLLYRLSLLTNLH